MYKTPYTVIYIAFTNLIAAKYETFNHKYFLAIAGVNIILTVARADPVGGIMLPGALNYTNQLHQQLLSVKNSRLGEYAVRTRHRNKDGTPKYTNRLVREESPYLLQHAHNPVNWYAWGEEAFATTNRLNLPIFLSIGYSTCHWCHVMEVESFDNENIARYLNENFISIKVDREQRPDLDEIYMTAVNIFIGRGGWPMSNFLTPEGKPFYGGTYYPPQQFLQLLHQVSTEWHENEKQLRADADTITQQIERFTSQSFQAAELNQDVINGAVKSVVSRWDKVHGGFSEAPKFPNETHLLVLLDQLRRTDNPGALMALEHSLHKMAQGGIYDQIAGGFHRYSTDVNWLVPHFEKMLYNQALLGRVYSQAYQLTGKDFYRRISQEIFDYVLRDMRAPSGGFYSATDADSEEEEGTFFLWQEKQLRQLLTKKDAQLFIDLYGVRALGNFQNKNILFLAQSIESYAQQHNQALPQLLTRLKKIKKKLYQIRERRIHPPRDEKVITAWNGMMITTLAQAAQLVDEPKYLIAATEAANYLWQKHVDKKNLHLWRVSLNGKPSINAIQEDYAYFAEALIAVYDASSEPLWLQRAQQLTDKMIQIYTDNKQGGFFTSAAKETGSLITRIKNSYDGAIPSGNSVAMQVLTQLLHRTGDLVYKNSLNAAWAGFSGRLKQQATNYTYMLIALANHLQGESSSKQYLAGGKVMAELSFEPLTDKKLSFTLALSIKEGWHINSDQPLSKKLIASEVFSLDEGDWQLENIQYPTPRKQTLSFQSQPLLLFEGKIEITGTLTSESSKKLIHLGLKLQACSDQLCLMPEQSVLTLRRNK